MMVEAQCIAVETLLENDDLRARVAELEKALCETVEQWECCRTSQECGDGPCNPLCDATITAARSVLAGTPTHR
jgi:hypothetical protein